MPSPYLFFLIFLVTILITRIALYFKPTPSPTIKGFRLHHYMYGIVIGMIGIIFSNIILFGIGLGLFIDEVPYLIIGGKNHKDNYSAKSILGVLILVIIIFFSKSFLTKILFR